MPDIGLISGVERKDIVIIFIGESHRTRICVTMRVQVETQIKPGKGKVRSQAKLHHKEVFRLDLEG